MKPLFISGAVFLAFAAALATVGTRPTTTPWSTAHYENVLGTSMEIKLIAASEAVEDRAEAAALAEIKRLDGVLSGYNPTSEFSRWARTRNQAVRVSSELMEVLQLWDSWRVRTGGALNPAAEAITRVWKRAERAS
jgi:thiamine biosynthesis lipoprotein